MSRYWDQSAVLVAGALALYDRAHLPVPPTRERVVATPDVSAHSVAWLS
jgi:hypothetical protein